MYNEFWKYFFLCLESNFEVLNKIWRGSSLSKMVVIWFTIHSIIWVFSHNFFGRRSRFMSAENGVIDWPTLYHQVLCQTKKDVHREPGTAQGSLQGRCDVPYSDLRVAQGLQGTPGGCRWRTTLWNVINVKNRWKRRPISQIPEPGPSDNPPGDQRRT